MKILGGILGGLSIALAAVTCFYHWAWCRGFEDGKRAGYQEGLDEGLEVGKIREANWWLDAEQGVDLAREQVRRH